MNLPLHDADQQSVMRSLLARLPGYVAGHVPGAFAAGTKGAALHQVFAKYLAQLDVGARGLHERHLLAFLDMLGIHLLPAQAARVPVVFRLTPDCPVDVTLAADSQLAAQPSPSPPAPLGGTTVSDPKAVLFFTEKTITLSRAKLAALFSVDPYNDVYADHSAALTSDFTVFGGMTRTKHEIYLGHDVLFKLGGSEITLLLQCMFDVTPTNPLDIHWQYLTNVGWITLQKAEEEDTTRGLTRDGQIALRLNCGPDAKQEIFHGRKSYWVRGTLTSPVIRGEDLRENPLTVNDLRIRVQYKKKDILPDAAFADGVPLDVSKDFFPFGQQPTLGSTFYFGSEEVFQRAGARAQLTVALTKAGIPKGVILAWEYFDGRRWQTLGIDPAASDPTIAFTFNRSSGTISFLCPTDWQSTKINGVDNYWLRVRIVDGNFGSPLHLALLATRSVTAISADRMVLTVNSNSGYTGGETVVVAKPGLADRSVSVERVRGATELVLVSALSGMDITTSGMVVGPAEGPPPLVPSTLEPPIIGKIGLSYTYVTDPESLHHCLTFNDFQFEDQTEAARWPDRSFDPFRPVSDLAPALHFAFDQKLPSGLVSLFVQAPGAEEEEPNTASPFAWEYLAQEGWRQLSVRDETNGLRQTGMVQFIGPPDAISKRGLGSDQELFRIRARLKPNTAIVEKPIRSVWLNGAWASHRFRVEQELLGVSDGTPNQALRFASAPVLAGETIEVQEWTGRGEGWQLLTRDIPESELRFEREPGAQKITAAWTRWSERPHLYASTPNDRVFIIERATGLIRFGNGTNGMGPPAGCRIVASYTSGGGMIGNVAASAVTQLRSAAPFVAGVTNPIAAEGGADAETKKSVVDRGPQKIRHRDRAITASDIEWNARDASPEVARARCLDITGPDGYAQRGWITVVVIPHSKDKQPQPTAELQRRVADHLRTRVPSTISRRIRVIEVAYVPVSVDAEIVPLNANDAALVELRVRQAIDLFLHPLSGGTGGNGWAFGDSLQMSNIAAVIEAVPGVDYARSIRLYVSGADQREAVAVPRDALLCSDTHELKLVLGAS